MDPSDHRARRGQGLGHPDHAGAPRCFRAPGRGSTKRAEQCQEDEERRRDAHAAADAGRPARLPAGLPMTAFPAAGDYYKAVQAAARAVTGAKRRAAEFVWDSLGPTLARGSSAVVFQASVEGKPQALRCYIRNDASSRDRYSALNAYLASHDLSPYVSGAIWLDEAITVNRTTWPVLTMEWIDGRTLNEYVDFL